MRIGALLGCIAAIHVYVDGSASARTVEVTWNSTALRIQFGGQAANSIARSVMGTPVVSNSDPGVAPSGEAIKAAKKRADGKAS